MSCEDSTEVGSARPSHCRFRGSTPIIAAVLLVATAGCGSGPSLPSSGPSSTSTPSASVSPGSLPPGPALPDDGQVRASISTVGVEGNARSYGPSVSSDGRYVAFASDAPNLVAADTNALRDVFVRDRSEQITTRVSVAADLAQQDPNGRSYGPAISSDGQHVALISEASNLVAGDTNDAADVFVFDRQANRTTRVSVSSSGGQANGRSVHPPAISSDGRYVAFESTASNLIAGDTNGEPDVFVHDRQTDETSRVSVGSGGAQAGDGSFGRPAISSDGRYVAFESTASNLVSGDTNGEPDVFVHDRQTGQTTRASVGASAAQADGPSEGPAISSDGRFVAFASDATNLVSGDTNAASDVFVHDRQTATTTRVSVGASAAQANGPSEGPAISSDGRFVAFTSDATNLVSGDTNGVTDVFVHDRQTGQTTRASVMASGAQVAGWSQDAAISPDASVVAFVSAASDLVPKDRNESSDVFVRPR